MRNLAYSVIILMAGVLGCAPITDGAKSFQGQGGMTSHDTGSCDTDKVAWSALSVDSLLTLFERSDLELEKKVFGKPWPDCIWYVMWELESRIAKEGLDSLSQGQRERLIKQIRWYLTHGRIDTRPLVKLAGQVDPDFTAGQLLANPERVQTMPKTAMIVFAKAGKTAEARRILNRQLESSDEVEVCEALATIGEAKLTFMADDVFGRTKALRWLIRLQALHTLDLLDDARATDALASHLADIRRHSIGFRILGGLFAALDAQASSQYLRVELMDALVRRKVPGAAETLKAIVLDRWEPFPPLRSRAGYDYFQLDPNGVVAIVRDLLSTGIEQDVLIGIEITEFSVLGTMGAYGSNQASLITRSLLPEVQRLAENSKSKDVRKAAQDALKSIAVTTDE